MKHLIAITAAVFLAAAPLKAEEQSDGILPNEEEMRELGALAERMLRQFADEASPMVERLKALVDDLDAYQAPEMLPNGDIIIRRKRDAEPAAPKTDDESVEL